ncbi:hypothetical protein [Salinivirga cyanobacteriivorans]
MKVKLVVISIVLMVLGFGMIHNGNPTIEYAGSAMIGVPALYLLFLLFRVYFKKHNDPLDSSK